MSEIRKEEKASEFIDRYTTEVDGQKRFNVIEAQMELYARIQSALRGIQEISQALGDYGMHAESIEKRLSEVEGKKTIEIVSVEEAKGAGVKFYQSPNDIYMK